MSILQLLDELPEAVSPNPSQLWSVFARSLGEQGADGRTALAWRWALTGACPSPVTLTTSAGRPPSRDHLVNEATAAAELAGSGNDHGGQIMQARFVLQWLAGEIDAVPLWNAGSNDLHMTDGAAYPHDRARIDEAYFWAQLAKFRHRWRDDSAVAAARHARGWALGAFEFLAWACGEASEGPLSGLRVFGRPTLREVSLDACRAMTGIDLARAAGDIARARRLESVMEAFLWLAGWNEIPPVDRHGHLAFEDCPERDALCGCDAAGRCLRDNCPACWRVVCVHGFGQEDVTDAVAGG